MDQSGSGHIDWYGLRSALGSNIYEDWQFKTKPSEVWRGGGGPQQETSALFLFLTCKFHKVQIFKHITL